MGRLLAALCGCFQAQSQAPKDPAAAYFSELGPHVAQRVVDLPRPSNIPYLDDLLEEGASAKAASSNPGSFRSVRSVSSMTGMRARSFAVASDPPPGNGESRELPRPNPTPSIRPLAAPSRLSSSACTAPPLCVSGVQDYIYSSAEGVTAWNAAHGHQAASEARLDSNGLAGGMHASVKAVGPAARPCTAPGSLSPL